MALTQRTGQMSTNHRGRTQVSHLSLERYHIPDAQFHRRIPLQISQLHAPVENGSTHKLERIQILSEVALPPGRGSAEISASHGIERTIRGRDLCDPSARFGHGP